MDRRPAEIDPYDADRPLRMACACGQHASSAEHAAAELRTRSVEPGFVERSNAFIEATLVKALFPHDAVRRDFIQ
jgi:nitrate/nitrite transport system substrate-binding protein